MVVVKRPGGVFEIGEVATVGEIDGTDIAPARFIAGFMLGLATFPVPGVALLGGVGKEEDAWVVPFPPTFPPIAPPVATSPTGEATGLFPFPETGVGGALNPPAPEGPDACGT
jgi:hypothetical protein